MSHDVPEPPDVRFWICLVSDHLLNQSSVHKGPTEKGRVAQTLGQDHEAVPAKKTAIGK